MKKGYWKEAIYNKYITCCECGHHYLRANIENTEMIKKCPNCGDAKESEVLSYED